MRNKFDEQLSELNSEMIKMGTMIENNIAKAVEALYKCDTGLAKEVMDSDEEVDRCQKKIENICFNLLIRQQPVARDLRTITAALKMVTDMERIGDHAADISEMTIYMGDKKHTPVLEKHISRMASETVLMLNWSIEAYVEKDKKKARDVILHDDIVDELFDEVKKDIISMILENPDGETATDLLMTAKYFERIGDHATNISEWVLYSLKKNEDEPITEDKKSRT